MNKNTTLALALLVVILGSLYYVLQTRPVTTDEETETPAFSPSAVAAKDLIEDELGDVVQVVCKRKDGEEWVFEKDTDATGTDAGTWRMTAPLEMKCIQWEVDRFGSQFGRLQYELSYRSGEPGAVTAAEAGLEPPEATVTLTDAEEKTVTVEVGNPAPNRGTYVRLAGSEEICVAKSDLQRLFKDSALAYRDTQLWDFKSADVTRVEIEDRSKAGASVSYAITRDGSRWMMESPVTARATSKVDDMLNQMGRLPGVKWYEDDPENLSMYGLDPAALTVRVTVEQEVPAEDGTDEEGTTEEAEAKQEAPSEEEEEEPAPEPVKKVTVYELHLSDRSPLGEDTKVYMRIGEEHAVATLGKTTADKFKPVMSQWREMHVTTANVGGARRINISTTDGAATLVKDKGVWSFEGDGGLAEESAVSDVLTAIGDLEAVAFVDEGTDDPATFGLEEPRARIELTIPGVEGTEQIAVGGYTDERTKRLVFVRRNELTSIGKARATDVARLLQGPRVYRDRTILDVLPSRFQRITLNTANRFADGSMELALEREDSTWTMVEPVGAPVREDQVDKLVEAMGGLRAEQVVGGEDEVSAYGLHAPAVTVTLTHRPLAEREPANTEDQGDDSATTTADTEPPLLTVELAVTEHDGHYYAKRSDTPVIYEVTEAFHKQLLAEYRTDRVLDFDGDQVNRFALRQGDETYVFVKQDDRWKYEAEPDLPLDTQKVQNLMLQVRDLRTLRHVVHAAADLAAFGLAKPAREATVTLADGTSHALWVSDQAGDNGTDRGFFSTVVGSGNVFLLTAESVKRLHVSLDELEERP